MTSKCILHSRHFIHVLLFNPHIPPYEMNTIIVLTLQVKKQPQRDYMAYSGLYS